MDLVQATEVVGGLSKPSKMPCYSYSIPAINCKVGSALRKVKGSVCHGCYAMKGFYNFPAVKNALEKRLASIDNPKWVEAMAFLINYYFQRKGVSFFRWHDSGDIQSFDHLLNILKVVALTPKVKHWIPTREYGIIAQLIKSDIVVPKNINIRLSASMIDGNYPKLNAEYITYSGVHTTDKAGKGVFSCPALKQDNECKDCRACWNRKVSKVSYHKH